MASGLRRHVRRAALAGSATIFILSVGASVAAAHAGHPASIAATVSGMSVQVSGTWTWKGSATDPLPSYVGYAISWGDVTSGNDVGTYHIGDGTAPTNVVFQPTSPDRGTGGSWGPVSHTFAAPGTYSVCSIIYDLGEVKPFPTSGQESLIAGGPNRNTDNSVDNGYTPAVECATVVIAAPATPSAATTATPTAAATATAVSSQGVAGATSMPSAANTPPPTSTDAPTQGGGTPIALLVLGLWAAFGAAGIRLYAIQRSRR